MNIMWTCTPCLHLQSAVLAERAEPDERGGDFYPGAADTCTQARRTHYMRSCGQIMGSCAMYSI